MELFFLLGILLSFSYVASQDVTCTCVRHYLCDKNNNTNIYGENLIGVRLGELSGCTMTSLQCANPCKKSPVQEVCCRLIKNSTSSTVTAPVQCGKANPGGIGFRIGTETEHAAFGEFPWMVGVLQNNGTYHCGGSLIHPSVVLTAAHSIDTTQNYLVRAGEWDSSGYTENLKHQDRKVASIRVHENYQTEIFFNDVALLFLESPFVLDEHIQTVCLPPPHAVVDSENCYATGWGKKNFGDTGKNPAILKKVLLPIVNKTQCQENLRATRLGEWFILNDSFVCAGGRKNQDTCLGDGGGPLFCPISGEVDKYQQIGITSWGIGCNEENIPGVYANVPFLRKWIDKEMRKKNIIQ